MTYINKLNIIKVDITNNEIVNKDCSICIESLKSNSIINNIDNNVYRLECNHYFHRNCLQKWLSSSMNKNCPNCRQIITI